MNKSHETDYQRTVTDVGKTHFLPQTSIEIVREPDLKQPHQFVVFDFDGTLSLVREGWPDVMVPMMVEILQQTGTEETSEELIKMVMQFVMELTGKQTIYQMIRLGEEIEKRGGVPEDPLVYKQIYNDLLMNRINTRREALRSGELSAEGMLVPGALELLQALESRCVEIFLASGTDEEFVKEEAELLGISQFFGPHIYGAVDDYKSFSKQMVIERILQENSVQGDLLLGFGDGYVEIENIKSAGGTSVAVASDESDRSGTPDVWKRDRLIGVGADIVIPDYQDCDALIAYLWNEK